jgi:outer membrane protein assembly factor BamB
MECYRVVRRTQAPRDKGTELLCAFATLCLCYFCLFGPAEAADWPNWRGPNHNGVSDETGWVTTWPAEGPKVLWKTSIGTGFSSMAVSNGRVYAMGNIDDSDILYCFQADTGKEIWRKSYRCPLFKKNHEGGPAATPTVSGDFVYTFSKNADAICFKAATGEVVWHKNLIKQLGIKNPTWYHASSPLIVDDLVIFNAGTQGVALNKTDGSLVWKNGDGPCGYATAVPFTVDNQKCVALFVSREIVAVVASTGKVLWHLSWRTSYDINAATPIISDDKMFISSGYNKGCALLKMDPPGAGKATEVWRNKNMRNHCSSCVLWKGHIYGFDGQYGGGGKLTCLDFDTGQMKWSQGGMGTGSLMVADGKLIILGERGKLVIAEASPERFEQLASAQILTGKCWTVPVLANGRIYARNADGQLVCVDVSGKS